MQSSLDFHLVFDVVSGAAVMAGSYGAWMVKTLLGKIALAQAQQDLRQAQIKADLLIQQGNMAEASRIRQEDLLRGQNELQREFSEKHQENKRGLAVHVNDDMRQFEHVEKTLSRIESKLDKISINH